MVNRVADKESAKSILKHNGNQAAMRRYAPTGKYCSACDSTCKMNGAHLMIQRQNLSVEDIKTFLF